MDNNLNDNWLDDILGQPEKAEEITADEHAVASAGLTHPDDLELERIVQETIAENWGADFGQQVPTRDPDATQFFTPQQFNTADLRTVNPDIPKAEETAAPEELSVENILNDEAFVQSLLGSDPPQDITASDATPANEPALDPVPANDPAKEAQAKKSTDSAVKKGRPAPKKGYGMFGIPHILSTCIWVVLILFIGITLGKTVWLCAEDLLALGKTGQAVSITIEEGDTLSDVSTKLQESGMIRYSTLFETFAKVTGKGNNIQAGTIDFDEKIVYDYNALISAMSFRGGSSDTIEVMIPEGYNCKQIFALLEEKGVCSVNDLENYAANGELSDYWFLEGVKRGNKYCLEGFLFPDTYEFYLDADPKSAIEKMLDGFEARFSDRLKEKFENLKADLKLDLTFYEMVIMASMVQKEKATDPEGYNIASVFYNRMCKPSEYPVLNCDSTIVYAQDVYAGQTAVIDSYDTYENSGLPPTPICNPGLSSLDAALDPEDTAYYYFVLDKEANEHVFARTYAEHQRNLQRLGYYD